MIVNKPWSVHVELSEGCNRRCKFCGIHSLYREGFIPYKFMSVETAKNIAKSLNTWLDKCRIEFAMQGEPLLNPNSTKIFNAFRTHFPKAQILLTSNIDMIRTPKVVGKEIDRIVCEVHPLSFGIKRLYERFLYWDKFGYPEYMVDRFVGDRESIFFLWWVDPKKEARLKKAMKNDTHLPIKEVDFKFWPNWNKNNK